MNKLEMDTKEHLKALGIYEPQFDITISIYAGLVEQYQALEKDFKKQKFKVIEKTGYAENSKKHPIVVSMESLRKDILSYSSSLGLTPAALKKIKSNMKNERPSASKLETALNNFGT